MPSSTGSAVSACSSRSSASDAAGLPAPAPRCYTSTVPASKNLTFREQLQRALAADSRRQSADVIYEVVMRAGGEPFGAPFEAGVASLTPKLAKLLKQTGFFGFETLERLGTRNRRNKFTRHGAAPYRGTYRQGRRR
jgi:hypothetical protein